jgi:hypothetical protein
MSCVPLPRRWARTSVISISPREPLSRLDLSKYEVGDQASSQGASRSADQAVMVAASAVAPFYGSDDISAAQVDQAAAHAPGRRGACGQLVAATACTRTMAGKGGYDPRPLSLPRDRTYGDGTELESVIRIGPA